MQNAFFVDKKKLKNLERISEHDLQKTFYQTHLNKKII